MEFLSFLLSQVEQWLREHQLGSEWRILIEALMFAIILFALRRSRLRLKEVVDELGRRVDELGRKLGQRIEAVQATVEQLPPAVPMAEAAGLADAAAGWERIRQLWSDARRRMELAIDNIPDGAVRRKYSDLTRLSYDKIIGNLRQDGVIGPAAADALAAMNERFVNLRRVRAASAQAADEFADLYHRANGELPKLPEAA
jgi:hypothetical protein